MVDKCKHCGKPIIKYPIKDEQGNIIWKNLFKTDLMSTLYFLTVMFLIISYRADIAKCDNVIKDPCDFCAKSNCLSNQILSDLNNDLPLEYSIPSITFNVNETQKRSIP